MTMGMKKNLPRTCLHKVEASEWSSEKDTDSDLTLHAAVTVVQFSSRGQSGAPRVPCASGGAVAQGDGTEM